ncbi:hypothetical protein JMJ35_005172 [Cladonia borealis]|uniref:Uncharacterized protein n=1 Tax=Cladonia borealis TaxID=184061 RepID=A0AA39R1S1_9LECA|nr:hypothetical protein JMJ35_005172 [Cladonia borealis]
MAQAKAVSKPLETATPTHETGPQSAPKSAPHTRSSCHASPKQSPRRSIQQNTSVTPISENSKPIPTSLSSDVGTDAESKKFSGRVNGQYD